MMRVSFYFATVQTWQELDYAKHRLGLSLLPKTRAIDIDLPEDLELAKTLFIL